MPWDNDISMLTIPGKMNFQSFVLILFFVLVSGVARAEDFFGPVGGVEFGGTIFRSEDYKAFENDFTTSHPQSVRPGFGFTLGVTFFKYIGIGGDAFVSLPGANPTIRIGVGPLVRLPFGNFLIQGQYSTGQWFSSVDTPVDHTSSISLKVNYWTAFVGYGEKSKYGLRFTHVSMGESKAIVNLRSSGYYNQLLFAIVSGF